MFRFKSFLLLFIVILIGCEKKFDNVIDFQNVPPIIRNLFAPDSLSVLPSDTLKILLTIDVYDADGLANIDKVFFNSYRPDGSLATGSPFYMYDDGQSGITGDQYKNDGTYSRIIILPPGTNPGKRRFEFIAIDKFQETSNIINHYINIK